MSPPLFLSTSRLRPVHILAATTTAEPTWLAENRDRKGLYSFIKPPCACSGGAADVLPTLFGEVIIPEAVRDELLLIPSARVLLNRLEQEAGMYLSDGLKDEALKTVGE